ncbi:MAG: hypothetical protein LBQ66_11930 [Planctomycetaceae bacterium]|nr:hypothetical protein [Planctomycetaceae bacterium]
MLTAVLSRYLAGHSDKVYMNPKAGYEFIGNTVETKPTISYISSVLETLNNGQWPAGTEIDKKYELGFELHIGGSTYEMQLLDSAGEDLKRIGITYDKTKLTAFQQKLFKYLMSSNVVIMIVNLDDFADARTLTQRSDCENTLKEAVDNLAKTGVCHHILVCFTAYDKYKAQIDQYRNGADSPLMEYLRRELPLFYHSCAMAARKVVLDYTEYDPSWKKVCDIKCIAVAPVIEERPNPRINPERYGKPPIGFDIRNTGHCWGMQQIADWLCKCEESNLLWAAIEEDIRRAKRQSDIISYRVFPILVSMALGVAACLLLDSENTTITFSFLVKSFMFGGGIGTGIGFLVGDKLKALIAKKDGIVFKKNRSDEEREESSTSPSTGSASTAPPRPSDAGGTSTAPPRPSGTGGTSATSGSETLD